MRLLQQPSASRTDQPTQLDNSGPSNKSPTEEDIPLPEQSHSPSTPARSNNPGPLTSPLPGSPSPAPGPKTMLPPQSAATRPKSFVESVTPDQAPRTAPTARPPKRDGCSTAESITPSLTDTQGLGSQSNASIPLVFPIFRHPHQSPPSVPVKGKKGKKTSLAGRGASRSTAGQ
ncbi:unnamed protein product [Cylindrotheca closterium]|uniref:Uncharacterized protein n=1 Tax=Cylindrotheca closterium TaxID=2856 RepID=A0AAD2G4W1_9STRA|nr:unnamed protein product [Cylindrotheca closterium]